VRCTGRLAVSRPAVGPVLLILAVAGACGNAPAGGPVVTREVRGDTTVVRTTGDAAVHTLAEELRVGRLDGPDEYTFGRISDLAVSEDGTIYVLDAQALEVRAYSPDGAFVRRFGRAGGGPGELGQPSGMVFLPDGRLVVRDPRNARMNVYSPSGESLDSWPIPGGFFTSAPIFADRHGNVYTDIIADRSGPGIGRTGLLRINAEGAVVDTLLRPLEDHVMPQLEAVSADGSGRSFYTVPFWPGAVTTLNTAGEFVGGIADRYAVHVWQHDGSILRIERAVEPVTVQTGESAMVVERTTRALRRTQPNWRWDGPRPPATKPYFRSLRVGLDGRIWVQRAQPAERRDPDPDARPDPSGLPPLEQWIEPTVFDVFEADGGYFGSVSVPERFTMMTMRGEYAWGTVRDEFDVQYIVRMRIGR
jgi:hypothetical protein